MSIMMSLIYLQPTPNTPHDILLIVMEFEKDKPATAEDIALANVPRVKLEPAHDGLRPDIGNSPNAASRPDNRNFEFETESTADAAMADTTRSRHPHHSVALVLTILTVVLFLAALAVLYIMR